MTDFAAARQAMVDCQVRPSDVTKYAIIEAMLWAPRELFVPKSFRDIAYADAEVPIADGRTLLEPRTLAKMLEAAAIDEGDLVLDLAPGLGYTTALLARLSAAVIAVEPDEALAAQLQETLGQIDVDNAVVSTGAPAEGDAAHGPYDLIFIGGAVERVPEELSAQLKDGGRLVAIVSEGGVGKCHVMVRAGNAFPSRFVFDADAPLLSGFEAEREFAF